MKLPKELTTVTPFSKYLAMGLFILFPFVGFYLGVLYQKGLSSQERYQLISKTSSKSIAPTLSPTPINTKTQQWTSYNGALTEYHNPLINISFSYPSQLHLQTQKAEPNDTGVILMATLRSNEYFYNYGMSDRTDEEMFNDRAMLVTIQAYHGTVLDSFLRELFNQKTQEGNKTFYQVLSPSFKYSNFPASNTITCNCSTGESPTKNVFFLYKGTIYSFSLHGGSGTGQSYSRKVESLFDKMIQSIKLN